MNQWPNPALPRTAPAVAELGGRYSDVVPAVFWALHDRSLLGLGTGTSKTVFHTVEVKEVSGPGKFQR